MPLPQHWDLPEKIRIRFGQKSSGKQRAMLADGHLLLVLHQAPDKDQRQRSATFFWRKPDGQWQAPTGSDGLVALQRHVKQYDAEEERIDLEYQRVDDSSDYFDILEELAPLKHAAHNMHRALQAAREGIPEDRDLIDLRDLAANIERNLELLQEDCRNGLEFSTARKAEEQATFARRASEAAHRLNILAAVFFPLMALTSIFGMNLRSGLEASPPWVFWTIFFSGAFLGILIHGWILQGQDKKSRRK